MHFLALKINGRMTNILFFVVNLKQEKTIVRIFCTVYRQKGSIMQIAIIDDETDFIDGLSRLCREYEAQIKETISISSFSCGEAFLSTFQEGMYHIVFMDVFMDGMDGVETARKMRQKDHSCFLIFLTSSADFMPEAFACHAFDYVTKPFTGQRIFHVLSDVQRRLPQLPPYIEIPGGRQPVPLLLSDIISATNDQHYLNIRSRDGAIRRCRMSMSRFIQLTGNDPRFLSVNRGILVNADYIRQIDKEHCTLTDGTKLPMRVRERQKLEDALHQYYFTKIRSSHRHTTTGQTAGDGSF